MKLAPMTSAKTSISIGVTGSTSSDAMPSARMT
jgi:hypothetical protein